MLGSAWKATRRGVSAACTRITGRPARAAAPQDTFELAPVGAPAVRDPTTSPAGALRARVAPLPRAAVTTQPLELLRTAPPVADLLISATYDAAYNYAWLREAYGEERLAGFAAVYPDLPLTASAPFPAERIVAMLAKLPSVQVLGGAEDLRDALARADYHMDALLSWIFSRHPGVRSVEERNRLRGIGARQFTVGGDAASPPQEQSVPLRFYTTPLGSLFSTLKDGPPSGALPLTTAPALRRAVGQKYLDALNRPWPHSAIEHPRLAFACAGAQVRYVLVFGA
jgi:hypothetical protein